MVFPGGAVSGFLVPDLVWSSSGGSEGPGGSGGSKGSGGSGGSGEHQPSSPRTTGFHLTRSSFGPWE